MDKDVVLVLRKNLEQLLFYGFDKYIDKTSNGISFNEKFFENAVNCLIRKFEDDKSIPSDLLHSEEFKKSLMDRFKNTDSHYEYPLLSSYYDLQKFYMDPNNTGAEILDYDKVFFTLKDPLGRDYSYRTKDFMAAFYSMTKDMHLFDSNFISECRDNVVNIARAYYQDEDKALEEFDKTVKNGDVSDLISSFGYYEKEPEEKIELPSSINITSKPVFPGASAPEPQVIQDEESYVLENTVGEAWAITSVNRVRYYLNRDINYNDTSLKFNKLLLERAVETIIEEMSYDERISEEELYSEDYIMNLRKQLISRDSSGEIALFHAFKNFESFVSNPEHDEILDEQVCLLKDPNGKEFVYTAEDFISTMQILQADLEMYDLGYNDEMENSIKQVCNKYGVDFEEAVSYYNEQTGENLSTEYTDKGDFVGYDNNGIPLFESDFTDYEDDFEDYEDDFEDYEPQKSNVSVVNGSATQIDYDIPEDVRRALELAHSLDEEPVKESKGRTR